MQVVWMLLSLQSETLFIYFYLFNSFSGGKFYTFEYFFSLVMMNCMKIDKKCQGPISPDNRKTKIHICMKIILSFNGTSFAS